MIDMDIDEHMIRCGEVGSSPVTEQSACRTVHRCGFSSCTEYMQRIYYANCNTRVAWPEGAPEDEIIRKVDALERKMRESAEDSVRIELAAERSTLLEELHSKLQARMDDSGKKCFIAVED